MIGPEAGGAPIDGVRNLVLTCHRCGNSHEKTNQHPLRPTLVAQTGMTPDERVATLRQAYSDATLRGVRTAWESPVELPPVF